MQLSETSNTFYPKLLIALLIGIRFLHFGQFIDEPHDWRQCDTAQYCYDYFENGVDIFNPGVCWMGNDKTVILEFPFPEAIVAYGYQVIGYESLPLARFIFLLFFLGAVYYLYKSIHLLFGQSVAELSTIVYLAMPLSQFYSRAMHVDFTAVFFAHGMLFYFLKSISLNSWKHWIIATGFAIPAFMIKVPYAFYFAIPLLYYTVKQNAFKQTLIKSPLLLIPILQFYFWQKYVYAVNGSAPDLDFLLHYRKFDNNSHWYFGPLSLRFDLYYLGRMIASGIMNIAAFVGVFLFLHGVYVSRKKEMIRFYWFWMLACVIYVEIFYNLNVHHHYYQIPLLATVALGIAFSLDSFSKTIKLSLLVTFIVAATVFSEYKYYNVREDLEEIASLIQSNTGKDDLVIVSHEQFDCRNPNILYRARRRGWSMQKDGISTAALHQLIERQAKYWAITADELLEGTNFDSNQWQVVLKKPLKYTPDKQLYILKPSN